MIDFINHPYVYEENDNPKYNCILIVEAMYGFSKSIPMCVMTDSYKATHFEQYPEATKMVAVRRHT